MQMGTFLPFRYSQPYCKKYCFADIEIWCLNIAANIEKLSTAIIHYLNVRYSDHRCIQISGTFTALQIECSLSRQNRFIGNDKAYSNVWNSLALYQQFEFMFEKMLV